MPPSIPRTLIRHAVVASLGLGLGYGLVVADDTLSVAVQSLSSPRPQPMAMAMPQNEPVAQPPQVTPAARMPMYQLNRTDVGTITNPASPSIRFLLAMPDRPLLVEVLVTIDGQPFAQSREQRIQKIVSFINDPAAFQRAESRAIRDLVPPAPPEAVKAVTAVPEPASEEPSASTAEKPEAELAETEKAEKPEDPVVAPVPRYSPPSTIYDRFERQMKSTGTKPSPQEVRWILSNWTDGPVLLFLNENFQRFRSAQQPLYFVLDTNRDGVISAEEVLGSVASLKSCDLDRNDVVESTEIAKVASDPRLRAATASSSPPLVYRLDTASAGDVLLSRLLAVYGASSQAEASRTIDPNQNGVIDEEERQSLLERPADLVLRVEFHTQSPEASRLTMVSATEGGRSLLSLAKSSSETIVFHFPTYALELSAVQGSDTDLISIGAVHDGYAMLPELDPNGDGRFTMRELRTFVDRLKTFDRNGDGSITADESLPTYRLCIALGPHAHQPLSVLRRTNAPKVLESKAPEWFVQMDKNMDRDLSRQEFPGTDEQFQKLDLDHDELVSSEEASSAAF